MGTEYGTVGVLSYDWQQFLEPYFKLLPGMKQVHHFRFCTDLPGTVYYKIKPDDEEMSFQLLRFKTNIPLFTEPVEVLPPGLTDPATVISVQ